MVKRQGVIQQLSGLNIATKRLHLSRMCQCLCRCSFICKPFLPRAKGYGE